MKARKLVKNETTKRHNIVFFGSYGYDVKDASSELLLDKVSSTPSDLFTQEVIDELSIAGTIYYNFINLNLYYDELERFIKITNENSTSFKWVIQFNVFDDKNNKNLYIQKCGEDPDEGKITIDSLIEEYKEYSIISNFILIILVENPTNDTFTIEFPQKSSKLVYTRKPNYTYTESQDVNYSTEQAGVRDSLIPRLSVIKGELWYKASYGLPLMDKIKSKGIYDSIIVRYITDHPDVTTLEEFGSTLAEHTYTFDSYINTIYGEKIYLSNK